MESNEDSLRKRVVAYLNLDDAADGRRFGASGTSSLHPFIRQLTHAVQQPAESVSVYEAWSAGGHGSSTGEPRVGDLGGGSDFGAFYNHLGLPSLDFGFGGAGGTYHSAYDTYTFQDRFGDPGGWSIVAAGQLTALTLARLGNADVPAFDYAYLGQYIGRLAREVATRDSARLADASALTEAAGALAEAGKRFASARDAALAKPDKKAIAAANAELRQVELSLARPSGLVGRAWYRNLLFAADRNNGYANIALPGIAEAAEDGDAVREAAEIADLAARVRTAASHLERATALLAPR